MIQPVMAYTGTYVGDDVVDFTFADDVVLDGVPAMLCINGAGGVVASSNAASVISGNTVEWL